MTSPSDTHMSGTQNVQNGDSVTSPARGAEMRNFLQARLLQKNRAPPLVHSWEFWHDRQDRAQQQLGVESNEPDEQLDIPSKANYEDRLVNLAPVNDVRSFWNVFNNFDITHLPLRDSVHLFHKGVKPIWEDPRNSKGGSWTFRVPKSAGPDFWKEVCMMAIGEKLQEAVESNRTTFRDDICGISLGVRFNSYLVQIWNRDGAHEEGIQRIINVVVGNLSGELAPREGSYYYKRHNEHAGFAGKGPDPTASSAAVARSIVGADGDVRLPSTNTAFDNSALDADGRRVADDAVEYMKETNAQMRQSMDRLSDRIDG